VKEEAERKLYQQQVAERAAAREAEEKRDKAVREEKQARERERADAARVAQLEKAKKEFMDTEKRLASEKV
jgi:hypothetical protein